MKRTRSSSALACLALAALAAAAAPASAGHLNEVLEARLDGREQVDPAAGNRAIVGDPDGRARAYVFGIDGDPLTLCYLIVDVQKVDEIKLAPGNGRAAHIHEGVRGSNGEVVANLAWPQDGQAADCLTEGEAGKFPTGEPGIVQRILANPGAFYVNLHNTVYPAGAIRGQLEATHRH